MSNLLEQLNPKQREAVLCTDGPLLLLAGAGSGKTNTMIHRVAYLIKEMNVKPYNILAVTFTNKAAGEMKERVEKKLGDGLPIWIMTFHATCLRILRKDADVLGYTSSFVIYDSTDQKTIVKEALKELKIDDKKFPPQMFLAEISKAKNNGYTVKEFEENSGGFKDDQIAKVFKIYENTLLKNSAMDFDDLLLNTVRLLKKAPDVLAEYQNRFQYIMVDEYQDTNKIQYEMIKLLAGDKQNLCVVGDDDQCIYQWRGADISNILDFERDYKGAKLIKLEQNYRSTESILAASNCVIENNSQRKGKKLWTDKKGGKLPIYQRLDSERGEAEYVAQEICRIKDEMNSYKDFVILYRTNAQSRTFEESLSARGIPYRVLGGTRYYDRKEIKDIIAYLRLIQNPKDDLSLTRVINEPKRGIGGKTLENLATLARVRRESIFETLLDDEVIGSLSKKAYESVRSFVEIVYKYSVEKDNLRVSDIFEGIIRDSGYIQALDAKDTIENQGRIENILELGTVIKNYEEKGELSLSDFLEKVALIAEIDNHDAEEEAVTLMTMHSAKGLEFSNVFVVGMEDGLFPGWRSLDSETAIEEERRLCYVAMTRAMENLWLTSAAYRMIYGNGDYTRESQFLREIDPKLITGDGVYMKKQEARLGTSIPNDGMGGAREDILKAAKRKVTAAAAPKESFLPAERVNHGKFGPGTVISIEGGIITVMFDGAGQKKLAADLAPLKKIN